MSCLRILALVSVSSMLAGGSINAADAIVAKDVIKEATAPPVIRQDEPIRDSLDLSLARQSLDQSVLHWQKSRGCVTCHTTVSYMMSRPSLSGGETAHNVVRTYLEEMVRNKWTEKGPAPVYIVATACSLAIHDKRTSGKLHPTTRIALDRMWDVQREDGGFDWLNCGWAPMELDDHYGVTFAAVGVGTAPDDYAKSPKAQKGLDGIRKYLKEQPAPTVHHRAMLLWASLGVDGILEDERKSAIRDEILALQLPDGGWSLSGMLTGWPEFTRKDDLKPLTDVSDAYATGMSVWLAIQAGVPSSDERIQKGIAWLKSHQRESGRWFTPSPTKDAHHYIANAGTAWAVMALDACGEIGNGKEH